MHFNFHLDGTESYEQTRRIANAVLALGGLLDSGAEHEPENGGSTAGEGPFADAISYNDFTGVVQKLVRNPIVPNENSERRVEAVDPTTGAQLTDNASRTEAQTAEIKATVTVPPIPATTDAKGFPWDERIHSSSRAVNADGTWRYRKNVPDETKLAVEHELRGVISVGERMEVSLPEISPAPVAAENLVGFTGLPEIPAVTVLPPPVVAANVERKYPDVVNLIMARRIPAEMYVAILGTDLPTFATTCKTDPTAATRMFDALDQASRPA